MNGGNNERCNGCSDESTGAMWGFRWKKDMKNKKGND
jgi:hypothetical protein